MEYEIQAPEDLGEPRRRLWELIFAMMVGAFLSGVASYAMGIHAAVVASEEHRDAFLRECASGFAYHDYAENRDVCSR